MSSFNYKKHPDCLKGGNKNFNILGGLSIKETDSGATSVISDMLKQLGKKVKKFITFRC
jgi:hypothetical protein